MAGDDSSFLTVPPHFGQVSAGGSENRWMSSKRFAHASHWYS
jgi:hypothetical protein